MTHLSRGAMVIAALSAIAVAAPAAAKPDPSVPVTQRTEKVGLKGRKGESLLRPGFAVGEYVGGSRSVATAVRVPGFHSKDKAKVSFTVDAPSLGGVVTGSCAGGESRTGLGWITFKEDKLRYACSYEGAGVAPGSGFTLALSEGSFLKRLQQPQRAGELHWGKSVIRAETKRVGGLPWGGGRVMGYVFSKDGVEIGALDIAMAPTFYLPPKGDPDRDAVAVLGLSLFLFQDPANSNH